MGRDNVQLETAVSTISQEYLLEFTSKHGISEDLHPELPGPGERIVDFLEGKGGCLSARDRGKHPLMLYQAVVFPKKLEQPILLGGREEAVMVLNTHRTPIQKQPEVLLCLVGLSRRYFLGDEVYGFVQFDPCYKPYQGEDWYPSSRCSRSSSFDRHCETEDQGQEAVAPEVPPPENMTTTGVAPKAGQAKGIAATGPRVIKEHRKKGNDEVYTNAPPKVLRRDHADSRPTQSTIGGKSITAMELGMGSTCPVPTSRDTPVDVSDPDPLSFADPSPESIYRSEWGVTNGCLLDASKACQDLVDHIAPPGYFSELHRDKRIQARENEIKNFETLLEAETDMKKTMKVKNAELGRELENLRALFSDLQVSNDRLSQQVSTLQAQVTREEKLKAAFEEFKQYEDNRVEKRCAEMDARLDALSIDFDEELYPHMLTAIAGRRLVIGHGDSKGMSEGLKYGVEHGKANLSLEAIEAYDSKAKAKYITALHALKDLKYPMVDQLESLKDTLIDVIMAALRLESDIGDDAPQWIPELHPSSSQLKILVYPELRDPTDHWACKEEMLLADAIAANVSRAEKKKKCRVVCRTHRVGSAHHARPDGVSVLVPTVSPQGLAILLTDAATQTEISEDEASPRLLRSSSLPAMHN
uniref:Transposase (Putative), gypsy type n=1 Tax=Tanacetum cinerariifolium TaxID=118510 RepID=A0A6L2P317_TANCI|nr:hypothetical protein [Tanacetum cinerariifolium]